MNRNCILNALRLVLYGISLTSCMTSIHWVSFDRLQAAPNTFPENVRRIGIINNQPEPLAGYNISDRLLWLDSQRMADSLAIRLADAAYFDEVIILDSALTHHENIESYEQRELSPSKVTELTASLDVDLLASIELAFYLSDTISELYPETGTLFSIIKLYIPDHQTPIDTIMSKQKIAWQHSVTDTEIMTRGIEIASNLPVSHIVPQWSTIEFPFYADGCLQLRDANVCIKENDWEGARTLWLSLLDEKSTRKQLFGNFNMAVWHEIHDDNINTASTYAHKALELALSRQKESGQPSSELLLIKHYLEDMIQRGDNLARLKQQMSRFPEEF